MGGGEYCIYLCLYLDWKSELVNFYKNACWELERPDILTILNGLTQKQSVFLHLFEPSLISLSSVLYFLVYESFTSLFRFIFFNVLYILMVLVLNFIY